MPTPFVIQQLAKKMRLEADLIPELARFFRSIGRQIRPVMSSTGRLPSMEPFREELTELLTRHYDRVSKAFQGDVAPNLTKSIIIKLPNHGYSNGDTIVRKLGSDNIGEYKITDADKDSFTYDILKPQKVSGIEAKQETPESIINESADKIDTALLGIIALRAPTQAGIILETIEKELSAAKDKAIIDAAVEGQKLTVAQQGRKVAEDFNSKIPGKANRIATFETQVMAEETKLTEAETISNSGIVVGGIAVALVMKKIWNTILDEVTRNSHAVADLQVRGLLIPFRVQGQFLRIPGDTSLGATVDNVIECRCGVSYSVIQ